MAAPGDVLDTHAGGCARLEQRIAEGGMGEVWRAELTGQDGRLGACAIKLLRGERAGHAQALRRFEREVAHLQRLDSPSIVRALDHGRCADGTPFVVMELVQGRDLGLLLAEEAPLALGRAAHLVEHIAAALQSAHELGIAHLDLKPSNVLVFEDGEREAVKLVDFGISQVISRHRSDPGAPSSSHENAVVGSLGYMAPERVSRPALIDQRSDQFSLAALAYEMITGVPAFPRSGDPRADLVLTVELQPARPSSLDPRLPAAVEQVLATALEKAPADRFATVSEFAGALASACAGSAGRRWLPARRARAAAAVATALVALALADLVLRLRALGALGGLRAALEDAAKTVFHFVQLPVAAALLVARLPRSMLLAAFRWFRAPAVAAAVAFTIVVTAVTAADVREAVCVRLTPPEDVGDAGLRAELRALRDASDPATAAVRRAAYEARLARARGLTCRYLEVASGRAIYSGFLTYVGLLFVAFLVFLLFLQLLVAGLRRVATFEVLGRCVLVLLPWIFLKALSEWSANFGVVRIDAYQPFLLTLAVSVAGALLVVLGSGGSRALVGAVVLVLLLSVGAFGMAVLSPGGWGAVGRAVFGLPPVHLVSVATVGVVVTVAVAFSAKRLAFLRVGAWAAPGGTRTQAHEAPGPSRPPAERQ